MDVTEEDIARAAKDWLKYACDQEGGRKEKEKKKQERQQAATATPIGDDSDQLIHPWVSHM